MGRFRQTRLGPVYERDYGGTGEPTVLVHGLGGSTIDWLGIAPRLEPHMRMFALDLPGFGLTPPSHDFHLSQHREALEAYVEELAEPVTIVASSSGGLVSEMLASERPDLISRLILICPATPIQFPDPLLHWPTLRRLAVQATPVLGTAYTRHLLATSTPEKLVKMGLEAWTRWPGRVPVAFYEAAIEQLRIRSNLPWAVHAASRTALSIALSYLNRPAFLRMIRRIAAPTLIIQGIDDHIVSPTAVKWLHRHRPDWDLVVMEDTGHVPMLDAPLRVADVIEKWLVDQAAPVNI